MTTVPTMVRSGTPGPTATWPGTYSVHSVLLHTKLPSVAVRGSGSRFELLLLEGLVFLKHILPQLVYAWGEENKQEETGQTDVRPCFPVGQTRTGRVISADLQGFPTPQSVSLVVALLSHQLVPQLRQFSDAS